MTMARGKDTCRILKDIRRQIAKANDIEFITSECRYKGDCLGTCPKCEAEVRYLEQQLHTRSLSGKAIALAGISASALAMSMPLPSIAQTHPDSTYLVADSVSISAPVDTFVVKGKVTGRWTSSNEKKEGFDTLTGACVLNRNTNKGTITDIDGNFEINACRGDLIEASFIGYESRTIIASDSSKPMNIILEQDSNALMGEVVIVDIQTRYIDFNIVDENGNHINWENIHIERLFLDEDGKEDSEDIDLKYINENNPYRIYWSSDDGLQDKDGNPLKKTMLRIKAKGYEEPIVITVKRPNHHSKKTIRFKHKKEKQS
jgi:hypothetical protein